jgi:hypothetical protein
MADEPEDVSGLPPDAYPFRGHKWSVRWPDRNRPRYELTYGFSQPPTFGLATWERRQATEQAVWKHEERPYRPTKDDLRDWLIWQKVVPEAAENIAATAIAAHPGLFTS